MPITGESKKSYVMLLLVAIVTACTIVMPSPIFAELSSSAQPALGQTGIGVGHEPYGIAVNSYTNTIYVANRNPGEVSVIDGKTNTVSTNIEIPASISGEPSGAPSGIAVNPYINKIYVSD